MIGQNFDGDYSIEARVASAVDLAHPARAERGDDFVMTESSPGVDHLFSNPPCNEKSGRLHAWPTFQSALHRHRVGGGAASFLHLFTRGAAAKVFEPIHYHIDLSGR